MQSNHEPSVGAWRWTLAPTAGTIHRMSATFPRSPHDREGGLLYFPRMLDKIRLKQRGELPEDYHANLGKGFDQTCCDFLEVAYEELAAQVESGLSDEEVLQWCARCGHHPTEAQIVIWNEYLRKCGWNDRLAERLRTRLEGLGLAGRSDIQTMLDLIEVDEGRPPGGSGARVV
jgi:gluconokinase